MPTIEWKTCYDCPIIKKLHTTVCPFLEHECVTGMNKTVIFMGAKSVIDKDCPFQNKNNYFDNLKKQTACIEAGFKKSIMRNASCNVEPVIK